MGCFMTIQLATKRTYLFLLLFVTTALYCVTVLQFLASLRGGSPIAIRLMPDFLIIT